MDKKLNIYVYVHTMNYYTDVRNDEILQFTAVWMELEGISLSDLSQKKDRDQM